jgi:presequence protease
MADTPRSKNSDLEPGQRLFGYRIDRILPLKAIGSTYFELEHFSTGARHVHIECPDQENTFGVAFKTVPSDSTGVAHILEHTVLCGSKKFPVRDPFFSMLKRSLSTFMNAFTSSDWTMYPYSTQNRKDFYNLMDVYLDAVFYPALDRLSFRQEGHRLELEEQESAGEKSVLVYKGVVYNEMKGAMSSPDQVMARSLLNALYPDTTYRFNSGGDPESIPHLTYQGLKEFHRRHYHPSNSFFYTYGNLPLKDHLEYIDKKILTNFTRVDPDTEVPSQPRWSAPKSVTYPFPFGKNENPEKKYQICLAWLTADIRKSYELLALELLEQILLGNAASPLKKALIESGLGTALSDGTGFVSDYRDTLFAAGLKDVEKAAAEEIETLILDVLTNLVQNGLENEMLEAAIHQMEFHRREKTNQPYPYGLKLLLSFSGSWFHGGDPVRTLNLDEDLDRLRKDMARGPFFEDQIRRHFLNNPHRVLFTLEPDPEMEERLAARCDRKLERIRSRLDEGAIEKIRNDARALSRLQDMEENPSVLPTLQISDIPSTVSRVNPTPAMAAVPATIYEQSTAGIFYFTAAIGIGKISGELLPLSPFFCYALSRIGSSRRSYAEMGRRIDLYTGGVGLSANSRTRFGENGDCLPFISFNAKCLERNVGPMFEILEEIFNDADFSDLDRLQALLMEYRAGLESMILQNGHRLAISLASRNFSITAALSERWSGIEQVRFIKDLTENLSGSRLESLAESLHQISAQAFTRSNLKMALIGESDSLKAAAPPSAELLNKMDPGTADGFSPPPLTPGKDLPREAWHTSSSVSFVAQSFTTVRMEDPDAPALSVIGKILRSLYLHREIREKGGAYGGLAVYNLEDGIFCLASYRDPHIVRTLNVFDGAGDFIRSGRISDEDVKEAVLQVCSDIDKPDPPGPAARKAFYRRIMSLADEPRLLFKTRLLSLTRETVLAAAERHFSNLDSRRSVSVISGNDQIRTANKKLEGRPLDIHQI